MHRSSFMVFGAALVASAAIASAAQADDASCKASLSKSGNFFSGMRYQASEKLPSTTPKAAYTKVIKYFLSNGDWKLGDHDKDLGYITASQDANLYGTHAADLKIQLNEEGRGTNVIAIFNVLGGMVAHHPADDVCGPIVAAE